MANREKKISVSAKKPPSPVHVTAKLQTPAKESIEELTSADSATTTTTNAKIIESEAASTASSLAANTVAPVSVEDAEAPKLTPIKNAKLKRKIKRPVSKKMLGTQTFSPATGKPRGRPKKVRPTDETVTTSSSTPTSAEKSKKVAAVSKNGARKNLMKKLKQEDEGPPILEPIFPVDAKSNGKRMKKRARKESAEDASETKKQRLAKRTKLDDDSETLEDVMNDLQTLISADDVSKHQESDGTSDSVGVKRKTGRKSKIDVASPKKLIVGNAKLIDELDLNVVNKVKRRIAKRRHSIEKIALEKNDSKMPGNVFGTIPRSISPRGKRGRKPRQSVEVPLTRKKNSPYATRSDSPARILRNGKHRKLKDIGLLDGIDILRRRRRRLCSDYSGSEISISKLSGYESDSSFSDMASIVGGNAESSNDREAAIVERKVLEIKKEIDLCNDTEQPERQSLADRDGENDGEEDDVDEEEVEEEDEEEETEEVAAPLMKIKKSLSSDTVLDSNANGELEEDDQFIDANSNLCADNSHIDTNDDDRPLAVTKEVADEERTDLSDKEPDELLSKVINPMYKAFNETKVPEKSIILNSMKNKFNENVTDQLENVREKEDGAMASEDEEDLQTLKLQLSTSVTEECEDDEQVTEKANVNRAQIDGCDNGEERLDEEDHETEVTDNNKSEIVAKEICDDTSVDVSGERMEIDCESSRADETKAINEADDRQNSDVQETSADRQDDDLIGKEDILHALGLQSLRAAEEAKQKQKEKNMFKGDIYTGTLKTVIKLPKFDKKKGRTSGKMTLQKTKKSTAGASRDDQFRDEDDYKIVKENGSNWKSGGQSSDTADGSSEHTSDGDTNGGEDVPGKTLVIPEKASSFSIHPDRLCKDECSYCFGKFGLYDTPCHIAQMKSVQRQDKILASEKHLTRDSCLCDACFRHVDRKSNMPSYASKSYKRNTLIAPGPKENHCHVLNCNKVATNILRRKWIIKMKKNINELINIDLDNPGLHSIPICDEHYAALEHLMVCAMCKRTLATNHVHHLGMEINELNNVLDNMGVPIKLNDKPIVCKLCRYFANVILKSIDERPDNSVEFIKEYKKRLLHFHNIERMDETEAKEPIPVPTKDKEPIKKKKKKILLTETSFHCESESAPSDSIMVPLSDSRPESRSDYIVDYQTLIPNIAIECDNDVIDTTKKDNTIKFNNTSTVLKKVSKPESVKEAVEMSKSFKLKNGNNNGCSSINNNSIKSDMAVQRLGSNPSISVRQLFPGEEELSIQAHIDFGNANERTPYGWEKYTSTIQVDQDTKLLWQELQKPYGNQSSFLRHLILLEKYFRNGDLILSPNASNNSINYSESVQNRLKAYDNIPSNVGPTQPLSMLPFNKTKRSSSGIITSKDALQANKANQMPFAQINNTSILTVNTNVAPSTTASSCGSKPKSPGLPPGLISLQPGTNKPVAPLQKIQNPQPHKIKFPITKNWRPNLIPIDPNCPKSDRKSGLVQVISGGKAFHITIEDYKKMCAIKRTFDLRQKRLQEQQQQQPNSRTIAANYGNAQSILKTIVPKKGLTITKTTSNLTSTTTTTTTPQPFHMGNNNRTGNNESAIVSASLVNCGDEYENSLDKLDKQLERLVKSDKEFERTDTKLNEKSLMTLPKIPKSLTVIPQSVTKKSTANRPTTPVLQITSRNNNNNKSSTSKS